MSGVLSRARGSSHPEPPTAICLSLRTEGGTEAETRAAGGPSPFSAGAARPVPGEVVRPGPRVPQLGKCPPLRPRPWVLLLSTRRKAGAPTTPAAQEPHPSPPRAPTGAPSACYLARPGRVSSPRGRGLMTWQPDRLSPSPRIPFKPRSPGTPPSPQPKASREEVVPPLLGYLRHSHVVLLGPPSSSGAPPSLTPFCVSANWPPTPM